jgi:hypothetical protein
MVPSIIPLEFVAALEGEKCLLGSTLGSKAVRKHVR